MRIIEVLSCLFLGWNCIGILIIECGLRIVIIVLGVWVIFLLNVVDLFWGENNEGYIKKLKKKK